MSSLEKGDYVRIMAGKNIGYCGTIVRWDLVRSGQLRVYPVVAIEHSGREVRTVLSSLERKER